MQSSPDDTKDCGSGFTLLEVMIALAILAMVLLVFQQVLARSIDLAADERFLLEAAMLARTRMAEIQSQRQPAGPAAGGFAAPFGMYRWNTEIAAPPPALITAISARAVAGLRLVHLQVSHQDHPGRKVELAFLEGFMPRKP